MSLITFPEPPDLEISFVDRTGNSRPLYFNKYDVSNPHPGFGKDPNILNEFGHTKYPMWVGDKIANNEDEEKVLRNPSSVPAVEVPAVNPEEPKTGW